MLLTALFLLATTSLASPSVDVVSEFDQSPLQTHNRLRWDRMLGRDVREAIHRLNSERGEFSFNALKKRPEALSRALRLQARACDAWLQNDSKEATRLYWRAYEALKAVDAISESIFCLYYLSEIAAERGDFHEFLRLNTLAITQLPPEPTPYLTGLLFESRAHTLWYLDHVDISVHYFSRTLELWKQINFTAGLLNGWQNLASIYTELGLLKRAEECFRKAILLIDPSSPKETIFHLYSQLALLYHRDYHEKKAHHFLNLLRQYNSTNINGFLLVRSEIENDPVLLERFQAASSHEEIERQLILGRIHLRNQEFENARESFQRALSISRRSQLNFYARKAVLLLGETLENEGRYHEAKDLYARAHRDESNEGSFSADLPGRKELPLLEGWIRCLMKMGQFARARGILHEYTPGLSSAKSARRLPIIAAVDEPLRSTSDTERSSPERLHPLAFEKTPEYALLELWPDQDEIFIWLDQEVQKSFVLEAPAPVRLLVRQISDPLYRTDKFLLPGPDRRLLHEFGHSIFENLRPHLKSTTLLLLPHKELQSLPFGLLMDDDGKFLFQNFSLSYLPGIDLLQAQGEPILEPPLLITHKSLSASRLEREIEFFGSNFPELRTTKKIPSNVRASWIHIASHFQISPESWNAPFLRAFDRQEFLSESLSCELLSLAACDTANTMASTSRFGIAESLMKTGARNLLMSRWKLDEFSINVYLDFFKNCKRGLTMDQALKRAKLDFYGQALDRNGRRLIAEHPWFWAGITYIGRPGKKLFVSSAEVTFGPSTLASLILSACLFAFAVKQITNRT